MTKPCECRDEDGDVCQHAEGHDGPHCGKFGPYRFVWDRRPGSEACEDRTMTKPCECRDADGDVCQLEEGHEGVHYGKFDRYHYVWDRPGSKACEVPFDETTPIRGWIPGLSDLDVLRARRLGEAPPGYVIDKAPAPAHDPVNHPAHYTTHPSGVECIAIAEHFGFCVGNAIKYLWRAGLKGDALEDLRKAKWYVEREIARREKGGT